MVTKKQIIQLKISLTKENKNDYVMNICSQYLGLLGTKDCIIYVNQQNNSPTQRFQICFNKGMSLQYSKRRKESLFASLSF